MKKGGIGGGHTITGLHFERRVNLLSKIAKLPGYNVRGNEIYYHDEYFATSYPKHDLYREFLIPRGVHHLDYVSKKYLPDEAIYVPGKNTLYVVEMKFQSGGGSTDEKLQTSDFKRRIYLKLLSSLKVNVEYIFVLSEFFDKPRYDDAYLYIKEVGCDYYFNELPLAAVGLPTPVATEGEYNPEDVELTA